MPSLSVLMPTYNGAAFLPAALSSIEAQRDADVELVAVDDGSTDETLAILRSFEQRVRMKIISRPHTGSWVAGTNVALEAAAGDYCSLLHQDDIWMPGRSAAVKEELSRAGDAALLVHPIWFLAPDGSRVGQWTVPLPARMPVPPETIGPLLLIQNFIAILGNVFPRRLALELGGLREDLWYTADWDLWLRLSDRGPTWHLPRKLAAYRFHPQTQTATRSAHLGDFREQLERVFEEHLRTRRPPGRRGRSIERLGRYSIEVNVGLAAKYHGAPSSLLRLASGFVALGPSGWSRFLRYSRIVERALSRVRAGRGGGVKESGRRRSRPT